MKPTRIQWLDYAKGIGIFLVVLGHTLRAMVNSEILESSITVNSIDRWIYAFHMPLFFLISGLLIERSISKPFNGNYRHNCLSNSHRTVPPLHLCQTMGIFINGHISGSYHRFGLISDDPVKIT